MQAGTRRLDHLENWIQIGKNELAVRFLMAIALHYVSAEETGSGTAISGISRGTITAVIFAICARPLPNKMLRSSLPKIVYNMIRY